MSSKAVQHEHNQCTLEAPPRFVIVDAPSTRLSLGRLVLTRAALRFIEPFHPTQSHIEHHSPCLQKSQGFGDWSPSTLDSTKRNSEIFFRIRIDQKYDRR